MATRVAEVAVHGRAAAAERAQLMQKWAVGALETAIDEEQAHEVLLRSIHGDQASSALDIALFIKAKEFLAQRHCLSLTARLWLQSTTEGPAVVLPDDIPYWRIFLYTIIPLLNPLLWPKPQKSTRAAQANASLATGVNNTLGAALAFAISAEERKHVQGNKSALERQVLRIEKTASMQPKHVRMDDEAEEATLSTMVRVFYSIPVVKFMWRLVFQIISFVLYVWLIFAAKSPADLMWESSSSTELDAIPFLHDGDPMEIVWLVVALCLLADSRYLMIVHSMSLSSGWTRLVKFIREMLLIAAVALRILMEFSQGDACHYYELCQAKVKWRPCAPPLAAPASSGRQPLDWLLPPSFGG